MDGRNPAPPKKPWNDDSPLKNPNDKWLPMVSKWCRISSIHSRGGPNGNGNRGQLGLGHCSDCEESPVVAKLGEGLGVDAEPGAWSRSPRIVPFSPLFFGEGSRTKIDDRKKGTLILTSLLEALVVLEGSPQVAVS